jgi:hypothetical protein
MATQSWVTHAVTPGFHVTGESVFKSFIVLHPQHQVVPTMGGF